MLLLRDERVLPALLRLPIQPNHGAFAFTVELGFHGALLRLLHRAHVIGLLRDRPLVTVLQVGTCLVRVRDDVPVTDRDALLLRRRRIGSGVKIS